MTIWVKLSKWASWYELEGDVYTGRWHSSCNNNCGYSTLTGTQIRRSDVVERLASDEQAEQFVADFVRLRLHKAMENV